MSIFTEKYILLPRLSAILIIYNEEDHLPDAITQLGFADEIIVVDSFSTDKTIDILKELPRVQIFQKEFKDFASQRNFAISKASGDWILFMDADERLTPRLTSEIKDTINNPDAAEAFKFKRQFMYKGKRLRFSGLQTDSVYRLFQRGKARYKVDRFVHEQLLVDGSTQTLNHKLLHYFYTTYEEYKSKMMAYGKLRGLELFEKGKRPNHFQRYVKPLYKFITHYIIRLGILDGKKGWDISYLNAVSVAERYREADRLFRRSPEV